MVHTPSYICIILLFVIARSDTYIYTTKFNLLSPLLFSFESAWKMIQCESNDYKDLYFLRSFFLKKKKTDTHTPHNSSFFFFHILAKNEIKENKQLYAQKDDYDKETAQVEHRTIAAAAAATNIVSWSLGTPSSRLHYWFIYAFEPIHRSLFFPPRKTILAEIKA